MPPRPADGTTGVEMGLPTHLRLLDPLGGGTGGTVWRARDTRRGRDVAVKLLDGDGAAEVLEHEARAHARLRGVEGVLALHECGLTARGVAWLATDLAEGSLAERLRGAPLGDDAARVLCAQLAGTLAEVHRLGVAHGDLTPANVLFGPDGRALLADFGLASRDGEPGRGGCTPAYAAPERLRGAPPSPASDVYSLAATVVAAAHGRPPGRSAPDGLPGWLLQCLDPRPSRRPDAARVAAAAGAHGRRRGVRRRRADR